MKKGANNIGHSEEYGTNMIFEAYFSSEKEMGRCKQEEKEAKSRTYAVQQRRKDLGSDIRLMIRKTEHSVILVEHEGKTYAFSADGDHLVVQEATNVKDFEVSLAIKNLSNSKEHEIGTKMKSVENYIDTYGCASASEGHLGSLSKIVQDVLSL